jgi:hypothetical protein
MTCGSSLSPPCLPPSASARGLGRAVDGEVISTAELGSGYLLEIGCEGSGSGNAVIVVLLDPCPSAAVPSRLISIVSAPDGGRAMGRATRAGVMVTSDLGG